MKKTPINKNSPFLITWRQIGEYIGVSANTVKKWHHTICKIPLSKLGHARNHRVIVKKAIIERWVKYIGKNRPLYSDASDEFAKSIRLLNKLDKQ